MANFLKLNIQLFAGDTTDKSKLTSTAGNYGYLQASFEEVADSVNTNTNKNKVKAKAILTQKTGSWAQMYTPLLEIWWYDNNKNKSGVKVATTEVSKLSSGDVKTAEGTIEVEHLSDGSLKGYAKAKWLQKVNNTLIYKDGEVSTDNIPLTTIPRANTFKNVPDSANVGQGFTVALDQKSNSFSTKLVCECNGKSESVETTTNSATFFLPKATFASAFGSNESKKTATITATTYNGKTQIGNSVTDTITLYLPQEAYKPVLSISAVDSNTNTKTLTGDTTGKTCVLNASTIVCTVSASAQNSATLSSVTINGKNVATTTTSYTISNPTTNVFTITASDSRGFSNTATDTLTKVVDYFKPTITANFKRNTPTDGKVKLTYSGKIFNKSFGAKSNECKFYYDYKLKSASSYTSVELKPTISGNTFSGSLTLPETYDYQQNYSFRLRVVDSLNTVIYAQDVAKGEPVLWWNEDSVNVNGSLTQKGSPVPFVKKSKNLLQETQNRKDVTQAYYSLIRGNFYAIAGQQYTISFNTNNNGGALYLHENIKHDGYKYVSCDGTRKTITFTATETKQYNNENILTPSKAVTTAYDITDIQIEMGSKATEFEPYDALSYMYINRGGGNELVYDGGKVLWTNPNPSSNVGYVWEGITLSSEDFDELEFWFYRNTERTYMLSTKTKKGYGAIAAYSNGYTGITYSRILTKGSTDTKYTINECYQCGTGITPPSGDNSGLIPAFIVGYKNRW
jgi:hypothetical protein